MDQVMKLKICEACGYIWCRPEGNSGAYCAPCELKLASFPTPESRVRRGRRPSHRGGNSSRYTRLPMKPGVHSDEQKLRQVERPEDDQA